jgi:hypothetical protein
MFLKEYYQTIGPWVTDHVNLLFDINSSEEFTASIFKKIKIQLTPGIATIICFPFKSLNTNFQLYSASIYRRPRYTAINCGEQKSGAASEFDSSSIRSFYSFRHIPGHNSFFCDNKRSTLRCNFGVKTHNT